MRLAEAIEDIMEEREEKRRLKMMQQQHEDNFWKRRSLLDMKAKKIIIFVPPDDEPNPLSGVLEVGGRVALKPARPLDEVVGVGTAAGGERGAREAGAAPPKRTTLPGPSLRTTESSLPRCGKRGSEPGSS